MVPEPEIVTCCQLGAVIPACWKKYELIFNMVIGLPFFWDLRVQVTCASYIGFLSLNNGRKIGVENKCPKEECPTSQDLFIILSKCSCGATSAYDASKDVHVSNATQRKDHGP